MKKTTVVLMTIAVAVLTVMVQGSDSPRFRGPNGDGVFPESGLLKQWPEGGPKLAWSATGLGAGYSSAVVVNGTVYVTGMDEAKQGILYAFGLDGKPKWKTIYGPELEKKGPAVAGTRGTPTVDGKQIFIMTGYAMLAILDADKGEVVKSIDLLKEFGAEQAQFGFAESVLVDGDMVICTPGGPEAALVALDRTSGETVWKTGGLGQPAGYCSARIVTWNNQRLILTMLGNGVVAVDEATGKAVWQHTNLQRPGVQPNPPLYADGKVYITSGRGAGGEMLALANTDPAAPPQWTDKTLDCQMQGTVLLDGCIYGTAQSGNKGLVCLDWKTGKPLWNAPETKQAITVAADGMLYVYAPDGTVYLVQPSTEGFKPAGKFTVTAGTNEHWAHPTIADGRLFIRHGDALLVYDIKKQAGNRTDRQVQIR